jgi:non-specific serine/threonine protein kinase
VASFEEVLDILGAEGDLLWQLEAWFALALASGMLGDTARAATCHKEILAITEPRGEVYYRSYSLWNLGVVAWQQGDRRRAAELVEQGLRLKQAMDDTVGSVMCMNTLAWIAASDDDPRRAATLLGSTAALSQAVGALAVPFPHLAGYHEECERQSRRALGEQAFQTAYQHGRGLAPGDAIAYALNEQPQAEPPPARTTQTMTLTRREREVADLVAEGLSNKDIAARLVISPRTAETHVERILTKLGFTSRTQIAAWAIPQASNAPDRRP